MEFWERGWTDCVLAVWILQKKDSKIIKHCNIHNRKTNQIIDVANGKIKMIDFDTWKEQQRILQWTTINRVNFELFKESIVAYDRMGRKMKYEEVGDPRLLGEMVLRFWKSMMFSNKGNKSRTAQNGGGRSRCDPKAFSGCYQQGGR